MSKLGPKQRQELNNLIKEYNDMKVNDSIETSITLGRYLDSYLRDNGLVYNKDFSNPPYREGILIKLSDKKVNKSEINESENNVDMDNEVREFQWDDEDISTEEKEETSKDCLNKFIEIMKNAHPQEPLSLVFRDIEDLYMEHKGDPCWDEAWKEWNSDKTIEESYDDHENYEKIASKVVIDSDGFTTEYTLYKDLDYNTYFTIFGDTDYYTPENSYHDFETSSREEALEWFNSYEGYIEHDDDNINVEVFPRIPDIDFKSLSDLTAFEDPDKYDGISVTYKKYNEEPKTEIVYDSKSDLEDVLSNNKYVEWYKFNDKNVNEDFEDKEDEYEVYWTDGDYEQVEFKGTYDDCLDYIKEAEKELDNEYGYGEYPEMMVRYIGESLNENNRHFYKEDDPDYMYFYEPPVNYKDPDEYTYYYIKAFDKDGNKIDYKVFLIEEDAIEYAKNSLSNNNIDEVKIYDTNNYECIKTYNRDEVKESLKESIDLSLYPDGYVELIDNEPAFIYDKLSDAQNGVYWDKAYDANETGHMREYKIMRWEDGELKELNESLNKKINESIMSREDLIDAIDKLYNDDYKRVEDAFEKLCKVDFTDIDDNGDEGYCSNFTTEELQRVYNALINNEDLSNIEPKHIMSDKEIPYKKVERNGVWDFPKGEEQKNKAIQYALKGWTIVYNGKVIDKYDIPNIEEKNPYLYNPHASGTGYYAYIGEYVDEDNKVYYFKLNDYKTVNLSV